MDTKELAIKLSEGLINHSSFGQGYIGMGTDVQAMELVKKVWADYPVLISEFEERIRCTRLTETQVRIFKNGQLSKQRKTEKRLSRDSIVETGKHVLRKYEPPGFVVNLNEMNDEDFK